jgi:hypothetical protein
MKKGTTTMHHRRILLSVAALALPFVAGACGSDDDGGSSSAAAGGSYCDIVKAADGDKGLNALLDSSDAPTKEAIDAMGKVFSDMAAKAPDAIKSDVESVRDFIKDDMVKIAELDTQTTDPAKLAKMMEDLAPLMKKMEGLEGQMDKIAEFTKTECGVDMND